MAYKQAIRLTLTSQTPIFGTGILKRWTGAAWVKALLKIYTGGSWTAKPMKRWNGSSWVAIDTTGA